MRLFISKEAALLTGATHEGTICGVPVWMGVQDRETVFACAKFVPLELWLGFCCWAFDVMLAFVPMDTTVEFPIVKGARIA
jgi:hypothetical protein